MTSEGKDWRTVQQFLGQGGLKELRSRIIQSIAHPVSSDYREWRHRFMLDRLQLCLWIAIFCFLSFLIHDILFMFVYPAQFNEHVGRLFGDPTLADRFRSLAVVTNVVIGTLLLLCLMLRHMRLGLRYPALIFLGISWSINLAPQIVGTLFQLPEMAAMIWVLVFLAQAILIPVKWQLHLGAQIGALAYCALINPLLGLTEIKGQPVYNPGFFVYLFWVCLICDLGVFLYERLKQTEFESQRQLKIFLHSVSHDLRTPVMGTAMVLQGLLKTPTEQISVNRAVLTRLQEGCDRQLMMLNALLEAYACELEPLQLQQESINLDALVHSVLSDLEPTLAKNQIRVENAIHPDLPPVYADTNQLWRVYCNLITNAVKHNPHGISIRLDAEVLAFPPRKHQTQTVNPQTTMLRCIVSDTGVGLEPAQTRQIFELYVRGKRARYMPGLGLGLYLCRQIITAHGGDIGVNSRPGQGATFWFTLPVAQ